MKLQEKGIGVAQRVEQGNGRIGVVSNNKTGSSEVWEVGKAYYTLCAGVVRGLDGKDSCKQER